MDNINAVSGERCSPHPHVFSDRLIRPGDQAFFDIIQTFIGYKTCYYRTFVVGPATDAQRDAYKRAREWIDASIELMRPGVTTDQVASVWPKAQEFGFDNEMECFGLQFGHSVGLFLHERPIISRLNSLDHPVELKEGMVIALETYCPAKDGYSAARIEEEVVITADGRAGHHPLPVRRTVRRQPVLMASDRDDCTVGLLGTGRMGSAMARALARAGPSLVALNRSRPGRGARRRAGSARPWPPRRPRRRRPPTWPSRWSPTTRRARPVHGPDGLLAGSAPGTVLVDLEHRRAGHHPGARGRPSGRRGAGILDSPVSGSVGLASRQLTLMVGGDADDLERARPVLEPLATRIFHMGPLGTGAAMKLAVNTVIFGLNGRSPRRSSWPSGRRRPRARLRRPRRERRRGAVRRLQAGRVPRPEGTPRRVRAGARRQGPAAHPRLRRCVGVPMPQAAVNLASIRAATADGRGERDFSTGRGHLRRQVTGR